jgi:hypothetical protein
MAKPERIQAKRVCDLEEIGRSRHVISVTAGPRIDLIVLSLDEPPDYRMTTPSGFGFPKLYADRPNHFHIDHFLGGKWHSLTLPATTENLRCVQPLGEKGWLVVRCRAKGEADRNAHVFNGEGMLCSSFHAGDAIEDVQTTERGDSWVSYFDEAPMSQSGLACFDDQGRSVFRFNDLGTAPHLLDCYALNVCSDREVWLCYYTDFPLVRLVDRKVARIWPKLNVKGSHAFAVSQHVLFAGKYSKPHDLFLADLGTMRVKERIPVNDNGKAIRSFTAFGRGSRLYLHSGAEVFVVDLADEG